MVSAREYGYDVMNTSLLQAFKGKHEYEYDMVIESLNFVCSSRFNYYMDGDTLFQ